MLVFVTIFAIVTVRGLLTTCNRKIVRKKAIKRTSPGKFKIRKAARTLKERREKWEKQADLVDNSIELEKDEIVVEARPPVTQLNEIKEDEDESIDSSRIIRPDINRLNEKHSLTSDLVKKNEND